MKGVINIGAHKGEQYNEWQKAGAKNFLFIEPVALNYKYLCNDLAGKPGVILMNIALGSYKGKVKMYVDQEHSGFSASILKPQGHYEDYPDIKFNKTEEVSIDRLDDIDYDRKLYDHIYITAQGMELEILRNGIKSLRYISTIKTQVYRKKLYEGCFLTEELTGFLYEQGFELMQVDSVGISWDYAYYKRFKK